MRTHALNRHLLSRGMRKKVEERRFNSRAEIRIVVKLGAVGETTGPGEDAGDGIGASGAALLVLSIVPRHRPMSGFRLHRPPVGTQQH